MSRPVVIAANWKMHKLRVEAQAWLRELEGRLDGVAPATQIVVAPPFTALEAALEARAEGVRIYAQNMHGASEGAFTGEVSAAMLREVGVDGVLLGHSERRQHFAESDEALADKVVAALDHGLIPMLCVGETLEQRSAGSEQQVVRAQLMTALAGVRADVAETIQVAYEPVWAIGTGQTASPEQAQQMHELVRRTLCDLWGTEIGIQIPVLYGGSVKPANAGELLGCADIDGALVGGASLEVESFAGILAAAPTTVAAS